MLPTAKREKTVTGSADGGTTGSFVLTLKQANCGTAAALRTTQIIDEVFTQRNHFSRFTDGSLSGKPQYLRKQVLDT
jgi:putative methionine-R-sulfoxide reductase with GAF domain